MQIDDVAITRFIIEQYNQKLLSNLELDAALVGAGPANLVAGYFLGKAGYRAAVFEAKLAPGGGMWGGGMMFNEIVLQEDALPLAEELGLRLREKEKGYYTADSVGATAKLITRCLEAGTSIFNLIRVTDVLFREENGSPRVSGLVINWSPVEKLELTVDPLSIKASFVVDGTGHPADICRVVARKLDVQLRTRTGGVVGEMPLWAHRGEQFTVANTAEVYPGLYVAGMAANNAFGGPRMGPVFGGMMLSGKKLADTIRERLNG